MWLRSRSSCPICRSPVKLEKSTVETHSPPSHKISVSLSSSSIDTLANDPHEVLVEMQMPSPPLPPPPLPSPPNLVTKSFKRILSMKCSRLDQPKVFPSSSCT
ncbi:hypothetical protein MKX03_007049 [Papaver bracteatum]|nr:hypothetical protein MKX03_007049 [Papaver bracteatum]